MVFRGLLLCKNWISSSYLFPRCGVNKNGGRMKSHDADIGTPDIGGFRRLPLTTIRDRCSESYDTLV